MIYKVVIGNDKSTDLTVLRRRRQTFRYAAFLDKHFPYLSHVKWANTHFVSRPWDWSCVGDLSPTAFENEALIETYFLFNKKDDAMLFKLTWHGDVFELPQYDTIRNMLGSI